MEETVIYQTGGGWGDRIAFQDYKKGTVVGYKPRIPRVGDLLHAELQSGRTGVFRFTEIELTSVHDMFFGHVEVVGYLDELEERLCE